MMLAWLVLDAAAVFGSLKIASLITGIVTATLALLVPLRLHSAWKRTRTTTLAIPFQDHQVLLQKMAAALKGYGYKFSSSPDGRMSFEAPGWQQSLGATPITVEYADSTTARITGAAMHMRRVASAFGGVRQLPYSPDSGFVPFLKQKSMPIVWILVVMFVLLFGVILYQKSGGVLSSPNLPDSSSGLVPLVAVAAVILALAGALFVFSRKRKPAPLVQPRDLRMPVSLTAEAAARGEELALNVPGKPDPVKFRVPPGIKDGASLRLKGEGVAGGDLYLDIAVR